jgi:hypothetical protein
MFSIFHKLHISLVLITIDSFSIFFLLSSFFFLLPFTSGEAMRAIMSKYDEDDDMDDTLDSMTSSLRMRSDMSAFSDDDDNNDNDSELEDIEILEVKEVNGISIGYVRNSEGKKVEVLLPNMNRSAKISANSRGRGRKRGGGSHVDTRKCFNCGASGHLSNECPKPRLTGSERAKLKKEAKEKPNSDGKKKNNNSKGVKGGGIGNAKGTKAANERQRKRNEKNKSSRANHNRKSGAVKKASKGM